MSRSLSRRQVMALVLDRLTPDHVAVFANGFISRDGFNDRDPESHFYMIGSMGLAASIGLGVALGNPAARVVVFDGDGNLLMGLGILPMVGAWRPRHFLHVVLDNGTYGSTGSQATIADAIDFVSVARASGYVRATSVESERALLGELDKLDKTDAPDGPALLHVRISEREGEAGRRVAHEPESIARRFSRAVASRSDAASRRV